MEAEARVGLLYEATLELRGPPELRGQLWILSAEGALPGLLSLPPGYAGRQR